MVTRRVPVRVKRAASEIGEHLAAWRKLQGLTAQQVAERANISRSTLHRIESGRSVSSDSLINVVRCLGQLDRLVEALDPYNTDLGRARASEALPRRVRHRGDQ